MKLCKVMMSIDFVLKHKSEKKGSESCDCGYFVKVQFYINKLGVGLEIK